MKRYNCTLSDKRGAFGDCMEAHSTGRYALFSDVEKLQRRMLEMLDKSNSTGVAIERAISTGSVLADHPLKSRLELLANHHKREQELAAQLSDSTRQCGVMADLVNRMVTMMVMAGDEAESGSCNPVKAWMFEAQEALAGKLPDPAVTVTETIRTAPERIWLQVGDQSHYHSEPFPSDTSEVSWCADSVVACEVPYVRADLVTADSAPMSGEKCTVTISGKGLLELVDFVCPDHETDREQQETEIVLLNREAFTSTDGEKMLRGVYAYLAEYPEEGLYGPVGGADAQGGEPCSTASPSSSKA